MRKFYIPGLMLLAAALIGLAWADEITLTTYYPAPFGVYKDMDVARRVYLKPADPTELAGEEQEGMIITDENDNTIKRWDGTAWVPFGATDYFPLVDVAMWYTSAGIPVDPIALMVAAVPSTSNIYVRLLSDLPIAQLDEQASWTGWTDFGSPDPSSKIVGVSVDFDYTDGGSAGALIVVRMSSGTVYVRSFEAAGVPALLVNEPSWGPWRNFGSPGL